MQRIDEAPDAQKPRSSIAAWWPYGLVLLAGLCVLLPSLGSFGLWDPWEPKYAQASREMVERGSYIVPYYLDEVRLAKPILAYWGIIAGWAVFGMNEFGARIGGVVFAIGAMLGVYYAVSLLRGRRAGLLCALVLCSVPQFFFLSRQAMPDAYLCPSIGIALVFLGLGLFGPDRRRNLHYAISYLGFALAVLAKGPIIVAPIYFTTLAIWGLVRFDYEEFQERRLIRPLVRVLLPIAVSLSLIASFPLSGKLGVDSTLLRVLAGCASVGGLGALVYSVFRLLRHEQIGPLVRPQLAPIRRQVLLFAGVMLVVAGPWHIAIVADLGTAYFTDFIVRHNFHRAAEKINSSGDTIYDVQTLLYGYYPWSCLFPVALGVLGNWWQRRAIKERSFEILMLISAAVTFAAFSASTTKFNHYLGPIMVPIALILGLTIDRLMEFKDSWATRLGWIVGAMMFVSPTLDLFTEEGSGATLLVRTFSKKYYVPNPMEPGSYFLTLMAVFGACLLISILIRSRLVIGTMVLAALLMGSYHSAFFIPRLTSIKTMKSLCEVWDSQGKPGGRLGLYGGVKHGIYYYTNDHMENLRSQSDFWEFMNPAAPRFCIIERDELATISREYMRMYPDARLHLSDDSHRDYVLMTNHPTMIVHGRQSWDSD